MGNGLDFIKRKGVGVSFSWKWGKPKGLGKDYCKKCETHRDKHWVQSHAFEPGEDNVG